MAHASRSSPGTPHRSTLVVHTLKLYFQSCPGPIGTAAERGIAGVAYRLLIEGHVAATGTTAADGLVTLHVPAGSHAVLEAFGTQYQIVGVATLEAATTVRGRQRRLQLLGYELAEVDGSFGARTGQAVLQFQADNGLDPTGNVDGTTESRLKTRFGE